MKYQEFAGMNISRLGFGAMRLPMLENGEIDYTLGQEIIDKAMAGGITYYDTAYKYHGGESENFMGVALSKYPRASYYLADKLPTWLCKTEDDAPAIFADQLAKCKTDYFDFYLLHNVEESSWANISRLHMVEYLRRELAAGRIRHLGASFHGGPALLREMLETYPDLEFIQLQINYMDWDYLNAKELHAIAREYHKPIIVMEPIRGGMLANPMSDRAREILDAAYAGNPTPDAPCHAYASYALRFVNELEGVMCTLSGMSTPEQLTDNLSIYEEPALSQAERTAIEESVAVLKADILVPCTGCNYCDECPSGIKIPEIFAAYNNAAAKGFHYIWGSLSGIYRKIQPGADACIACGNCESHCPQKIHIIDMLKEIHAKYDHLAEIGE